MTNEQKIREKISTTEGLANYLTTYDDSCENLLQVIVKDLKRKMKQLITKLIG